MACTLSGAYKGASGIPAEYRDGLKYRSRLEGLGDRLAKRLERTLRGARAEGIQLVKVIHGYGSTGSGGAIKRAVHRRLAAWKREGRIREFVPGEEWGVYHEGTRRILEECGDPEPDPDLRGQNEGITIIFLSGGGPVRR